MLGKIVSNNISVEVDYSKRSIFHEYDFVKFAIKKLYDILTTLIKL